MIDLREALKKAVDALGERKIDALVKETLRRLDATDQEIDKFRPQDPFRNGSWHCIIDSSRTQ